MSLVIDIILRFNLYTFIQSWGRKLIETMGTEANIRIIQVSLPISTQYHSRHKLQSLNMYFFHSGMPHPFCCVI